MNKYKSFLQWWLIVTVISVASTFAYFYDLHLKLWHGDWTYISELILGLFVITTIYLGQVSWRMSKNPNDYSSEIEHGWFMGSLFMKLGMLGTVTGFVSMLKGFMYVDIGNITTVQNLIVDLSSGISVALYTTWVGITCNLLLSIQTYLLANNNADQV